MKSLLLRLVLLFAGSIAAASAKPLGLEDVLTSVRQQYPPLLAAWMQQDIASGRVRKAEGAFDPTLSATLNIRPLNFYDGSNSEIIIEQPLRELGGSIYGGYRISEGFLPEYERKIRTADAGEAVLGFRLPLLRNRNFDSRRATLEQAELDRELTKPLILKQHLAFLRSARVTYFTWLAAGKRLAVAEQVLQVAQERDSSIGEQVKEGALAPILQIDNHRLVVSREIAVLNAQRRFEEASIALSLFHRNLQTGEPIRATREDLPTDFPALPELETLDHISDRGRAAFRRPEIRQLDLLMAKKGVERRLAQNNLKPNLDFSVELNQAFGGGRPSDIDKTEVTALLGFSIPIGQNEAKGRVQAVEGTLAKLETERDFARERILADADDSYSAVQVSYLALSQTLLNVQLSEELERAENEKFTQGASDLLALQIREQATFDARQLEIDARFNSFKAMADYHAAVAKDAPSHLPPLTR